MHEYNIPADGVMFDKGGGGKQHVDRLREMGHNVRSVGFGESAMDISRFSRRFRSTAIKTDLDEVRYAYKDRRSQMYGELRNRLDPGMNEHVFAIPPEYSELRRQLAPIPLLHDQEGRLKLPPKHKRNKDSREITLVDLIGNSPDEADALVMALFALSHKGVRKSVGVGF